MTIETLYFQCYYGFLLGDYQKAITFYELLKEEFASTGNVQSLQPHQFKQLSLIRDSLKTGSLPHTQWVEPTSVSTSPGAMASSQTELIKRIHFQGVSRLKEILDAPLELYNIEHPCGQYGRVDMVYMGNRTVFPVEVKKGEAEHDIIGQIAKYDLYHRLRLHYKHYDFVTSVTICASYPSYVLQELKKHGVTTVVYQLTGKTGISLSMV